MAFFKSIKVNKALFKTLMVLFLLFTFLMMTFLFFAFRFSSKAWFSNTKAVEGNGIQVSARGETFDLAVDLSALPDETNEADIIAFLSNEGYSRDLITENTSNIMGYMVDEAPKSNEEVKLAPGSFGYISFFIVPKEEGSQSFSISFQIRGGSTRAIMSPVSTDIEQQLKGHILLFESRTASSGQYFHYSDLITDTITYNTDDHEDDKIEQPDGRCFYPVTIYWIWPSTFGQMIYDETNAKISGRSVFQSENDEDRSELINLMSTHPEMFFLNLDGDAEGYVDMFSNEASIENNFVALSEGYNNTDQNIGDNTKWVIVDIEVRSSVG